MLTTGRSVRGRAIFTIILGILLALAGILAWIFTTHQLGAQGITVPTNEYGGIMSAFSGHRVNNPLAAMAQAEVINEHTMAATGGRTFAQIPQGEEVRATAQTAAFLQASLFTSVLAFALSLLVFALGILFIVIGSALYHLSDRFDGLGNALASGGYGPNREGVVLDPGVSYTAPLATQYVETTQVDYGTPTTYVANPNNGYGPGR